MSIMKKRVVGGMGALLLFFCIAVSAQQTQDSVMKFSLEEAKAYALTNSPVIKNANLDLESAKKKVWETASIGMPQVNAKASYSYIITLPDMYASFAGLGSLGYWMYGVDQYLGATSGGMWNPTVPQPEGTPKPMDLDKMKWNATLDVTVSQILFSGAWIVGLQTSKAFKGLSELAITKSEKDIRENVSNAYFLVLVSQENKQVIDSTYENTVKILSQIDAMNKQGLTDETDVDQLQLTVSTIKNAKEMLTRQVEIATNLLRFQMGLSMTQPVVLTDNLKALSAGLESDALLLKEFQLENQVEYKLLATQERLALMNLKYNKSSVLPDIAAFYQHQEYMNKDAFVLTPPNLVGVGMNIPIFASGQRYMKISQAKIGLMKAQNTKFQASEGLVMGYNEAKSGYLTAYNKFNTNKGNLKLSEKIYQRTLTKYQQGMASSLELTQAQNQYLQNQTNYFMSIFELVSAQNKLAKYVGDN